MKTLLFATAAALTIAGSPVLAAPCTPLSNFGANGASLSNVLTCTATGGNVVTVTGTGAGFTRLDEGSGWAGEFPVGDPLLYDNGPGSVTITFANDITSTKNFAIQADLTGAYTATFTAFLDGVQVGTQSYNGNNALGPEGTIPSFNFTNAGGYDTIVLSTTNDGSGFALGFTAGFSVPEPATWAMMLTGFLGLGAVMRSRRKLATASV